jgi:DNA polymerase-3 subunit gamma/tau
MTGAAADNFQVLARRYRPQLFPEVIGQDTIVRTLTNAITRDRIAHAYLFHGTRGVGKTTMARLLAKALNCAKGPTHEPCNTCDSCREVTGGTAVDVLEIDGASHNRVDDVRDLQDSLNYQPIRDRYRVVIIDEVHMLSRSAFNALLKTLEEPPGHVIFILATTELEKIPATILSRCQHFTFQRVSRADLHRHLGKVADLEKLKLSANSLSMVARQAAGSVRDALSALDQVVSFCGTEAGDADVEAVLGSLPAARVDELLLHITGGNPGGALRTLRSAEDRGDDPTRFAEALLLRLRDLSVLAAVGADTDLVEAGAEERRELAAMAEQVGEDALVRLFQMASQLEPALRHSRHPRMLMELTALKMVRAADLTPLSELAARLTAPGAAGRGPETSPGGGSRRSRAARASTRPDQQAAAASAGKPLDMDRLRAAVENRRPAVAAFLEHAEGTLTDGVLHLTFQPRHSFFKKSVEMPANAEALEQSMQEVLGDGVTLRLGLAARNQPAPAPAPEKEADQRRRLLEDARKQPAVRSLRNVFGAEIVNIQPANPPTDVSSRETES